MRYLAFTFLFASMNVLACWRIEGSVAVDGETYKLDFKADHGKEYIFPMGVFIYKMTVDKGKEKGKQLVKYVLQEKKKTALTLITKGEEEVSEGKSEDIYAKGEEGQPNSIITIKLTSN